ncbi:hypothetical protein BHE74_00028909 [Ensete ventricosum]|nr:hypothetical protein BHE74_00028909 [Ensete ventricosum]RZS18974.1 hypothetical protein BHM03_00051315 [Ensete ventricosum]
MRTARYRAVLSIGVVSAPLPFEIDRRRSISGGINQAREKEEEGEEKLSLPIRRSRCPCDPSLASHFFSLRGEMKCLPTWREGTR